MSIDISETLLLQEIILLIVGDQASLWSLCDEDVSMTRYNQNYHGQLYEGVRSFGYATIEIAGLTTFLVLL